MTARRRLLLFVLAVSTVLVAPGVARAEAFSLDDATVRVDVREDGALAVTEAITVSFSGGFHYGYRDIPLRKGESLVDPSVSEDGRAYLPGGPTELAPGPEGRFGVTRHGDGMRIVWYFSASNERRTFRISYTLRGVAVAYDDVVDVNLEVWGDQWAEPLARLVAVEDDPGAIRRAWGKPAWVRGDVELSGERATLRAVSVASHQFVELRTLVPRSAFTSTAGMRVVRGNGLDRIVEEERADAASVQRDHDRIHDWVRHPLRTFGVLAALALLPALVVILLVWFFLGRERKTGYDREYEQEPPTLTEPALVPSLLRQGGDAGSYEFTATLFDLIRRGVYRAEQVTTERKIWAGLRTEHLSDLEISRGGDTTLTPWEEHVAEVADHVLDGRPAKLSKFRERIEDEREDQSKRFKAFKDSVRSAIDARRWFQSIGAMPLVGAVVLLGGSGALLLWIASQRWRSVYPRYVDVVLVALGICLVVNAAIVLGALVFLRKVWRRRAPAAEAEAERWSAFRRYLTDFPRLQEAPPATLELWERYLVYGIAFGIAERVLQGAQIHMPEALHNASAIYWISPSGDLGSGASALGIGDLASGFGEALAPPNSGSGGFGGGFSGGGGAGGGGGGGGFG